jgi:hypothetical protein
MDTGTTKACPFCQQMTATTDHYCRHCGRNIEPAAPVAVAPAPVKKKSLSPGAFAGIVIGLIALSCVFLSVSGIGLQLLQSTSSVRLEGWEGHIVSDGTTLAARDLNEFEQLATISPAALGRLIDIDQAFVVQAGTRIVVLEVRSARTRVRFLDGEHDGKSAWVLTTFVGK